MNIGDKYISTDDGKFEIVGLYPHPNTIRSVMIKWDDGNHQTYEIGYFNSKINTGEFKLLNEVKVVDDVSTSSTTEELNTDSVKTAEVEITNQFDGFKYEPETGSYVSELTRVGIGGEVITDTYCITKIGPYWKILKKIKAYSLYGKKDTPVDAYAEHSSLYFENIEDAINSI